MEAVGTVKSREIGGAEGIFGLKGVSAARKPETVSSKETTQTEKPRPDQEGMARDNRDRIERIARAMDDYLKSTQKELEIQVHEETGKIMVKIISKEDGKVVREVPPEEMLNLAARMEQMVGVLIDENV